MLTLEARVQLAVNVYETVFNHTETFQEDHIGADLSYLLGAILKDSWCQWRWDRPIIRLLKQHYPEESPLWNFLHPSTAVNA